jgi:hypothetical protein
VDLTVDVDEDMPSHAIYCTRDGDDVRLNASPRIDAGVLEVLREDFAAMVAEAVRDA